MPSWATATLGTVPGDPFPFFLYSLEVLINGSVSGLWAGQFFVAQESLGIAGHLSFFFLRAKCWWSPQCDARFQMSGTSLAKNVASGESMG